MTPEQFLAERDRRMTFDLSNPERRHEPEGVVSPELERLIAQITPENRHGEVGLREPNVDRMSVLTEAENLIHGARNSDYGHPLDNHTATADLMSAYLSRKHGVSVKMDAEDVCIFNVLQKVSRLANTPGHRDSLVDIGGYVGCVEMIQDERKARAA
jgi:hypothetical protein